MKNTLYAALFGFLLFACKKQDSFIKTNEYVAIVQAHLRDSLSAQDFASLDFSAGVVSSIDSLHIRVLRVPRYGQPVTTDFFVVKTDEAGHIYSGRFVKIAKDTVQRNSFTGAVIYRYMKGVQKVTRLTGGHIVKPPAGTVASLMAEEPEMDGGELPPVVVTASYGSGGISYADWYNLLEMAGDDGYTYTGYYSPSGGGGGGGGSSSAPTMQVDFEAPENKDAIDVSKYIKCFGTTQNASADYTFTIAVDLPVDNDPSKIFNWSDASPGHTFIEFYKNGDGGLVQQYVGFYPNSSWKTVVGPDNIASKIADDAGHEYQAKYTISVSASQFQNALRAAQNYSAYQYNVADFNCADFALKVFTAAGGNLSVPQFQIPGFPSADGSNTPEGVYDAIAGLVLAGNTHAVANGQKQWVGDSHGPCE